MKYEGETVYTFGEKQLVSDCEHVVILPKGCSYEWHCTKAGHFSIIEFGCPATWPEPVAFPVKHGDHILQLFRGLEFARNRKTPTTEMESIRDLYSILLQAARASEYLPTKKQERVAPAVEYISQNYTKPITNRELAALTGLSTVYFRKLFTEVMGTSPMVYARRLRIEKASELLRTTDIRIGEVAAAVGYSSDSSFRRAFKKITGVSPVDYRTSH